MQIPGHDAVSIYITPNVNQTCGSKPERHRYVFDHDFSTLMLNCLEPGDEGSTVSLYGWDKVLSSDYK